LAPDIAAIDALNLRTITLAESIRSVALAPLLGARQLIGAVMVCFSEPHAFSDAEMSLLHAISYHAGYAIDRTIAETARLRERSTDYVGRFRSLARILDDSGGDFGDAAGIALRCRRTQPEANGVLDRAAVAADEMDVLVLARAVVGG